MRTRSNTTAGAVVASNESISEVLGAPQTTRSGNKAQPPREDVKTDKKNAKRKPTTGEKVSPGTVREWHNTNSTLEAAAHAGYP